MRIVGTIADTRSTAISTARRDDDIIATIAGAMIVRTPRLIEAIRTRSRATHTATTIEALLEIAAVDLLGNQNANASIAENGRTAIWHQIASKNTGVATAMIVMSQVTILVGGTVAKKKVVGVAIVTENDARAAMIEG